MGHLDNITARTPWLTVSEGAKYCRRRESELREAINDGVIPAYRKGERYTLVHVSDLDKWVMSDPVKPYTGERGE